MTKNTQTVTIKYLKNEMQSMKESDAVVIKCGEKLYSVIGHKATIDLGTPQRRRLVIVTGKSFKDSLDQFDQTPEGIKQIMAIVLTALVKNLRYDLSELPRHTYVVICDIDNKKIFTLNGTRVINGSDDNPLYFAMYIGEEIFLEDTNKDQQANPDTL